MANMKELLPKGEYKIKTVGPNREWEYNGNKNITDSVQLEGQEQYWIDLNRAADKPAPVAGDVVKGHVEQDEAGKFPPKFKKEYNGGGGGNWGGGGGKGASQGAIWSSAVETAATIVAAYAEISGKKPKSMTEFLGQIEKIAPKVNAMVDKLKDANKPAETTAAADAPATESGESAAPAAAPKADVVVEDISDEELGDW